MFNIFFFPEVVPFMG